MNQSQSQLSNPSTSKLNYPRHRYRPKSPSPITPQQHKISYWTNKSRKTPQTNQNNSYKHQQKITPTPLQNKSPEKGQNQHKKHSNNFDRIKTMMQQARTQHQKMKLNIQQMKRQKQETEYKQIRSLKFTPQTTKQPRYSISTTFQQRMDHQNAAKTERLSKMQQTHAQTQLKECTFSPSLSPKTRKIIQQKQKLRTEAFELRKEEFTGLDRVRTVYQENPKPKEQKFNFSLKTAKRVIHSYLDKLQLN